MLRNSGRRVPSLCVFVSLWFRMSSCAICHFLRTKKPHLKRSKRSDLDPTVSGNRSFAATSNRAMASAEEWDQFVADLKEIDLYPPVQCSIFEISLWPSVSASLV